MSNILVINGPNLNLLGTREPEVYGKETLSDIEKSLEKIAKSKNITINFVQSNAEHEIINCIQSAKNNSIEFIIINPGPLTHTSIALRDTFLSTQIPLLLLKRSCYVLFLLVQQNLEYLKSAQNQIATMRD